MHVTKIGARKVLSTTGAALAIAGVVVVGGGQSASAAPPAAAKAPSGTATAVAAPSAGPAVSGHRTLSTRLQRPTATGTPVSFDRVPKAVQASLRASVAAAMRARGDKVSMPVRPSFAITATPGPVAGCVGYKSATAQILTGTTYYTVYFSATVDCSQAPGIFAVAAQAGGRWCDWSGNCGQVAPTWSYWQNQRTYTYTIGQAVGSYTKVYPASDFGAVAAWDGSQTYTWVVQ